MASKYKATMQYATMVCPVAYHQQASNITILHYRICNAMQPIATKCHTSAFCTLYHINTMRNIIQRTGHHPVKIFLEPCIADKTCTVFPHSQPTLIKSRHWDATIISIHHFHAFDVHQISKNLNRSAAFWSHYILHDCGVESQQRRLVLVKPLKLNVDVGY